MDEDRGSAALPGIRLHSLLEGHDRGRAAKNPVSKTVAMAN